MSIKPAGIVGLAVVGALVATFASWAWWSSSSTPAAAATPPASEPNIEDVAERAQEESLGAIAVRDAAPIEDDEVDPAAARHEFMVRVMDHFAEPLADIELSVRFESRGGGSVGQWMRASTNVRGECVFDLAKAPGVPASWLAASAKPPPGYRADRVRVPVQAELAELVLIRTGRLSGRVSYADGSLPESGTKLRVSWALNNSVHGEERTSIVDGRYAFESGPIGRIEHASLERGGQRVRELAFAVQGVTVDAGGQAFHDFVFVR